MLFNGPATLAELSEIETAFENQLFFSFQTSANDVSFYLMNNFQNFNDFFQINYIR